MSNPERKKIAWDETWNAAYGWYSELASGSVNSMKMKNLVEKLMSAPDLAGLFAHTTAASLVISPYSIYPDWAEGRRISLQARGENVVRVQLNALGGEPETWDVEFSTAAELVKRLCSKNL